MRAGRRPAPAAVYCAWLTRSVDALEICRCTVPHHFLDGGFMRIAPPNRRSVVVLTVLAASAIALVPATLASAREVPPGVVRVNPATPVTTPHGLIPVYD